MSYKTPTLRELKITALELKKYTGKNPKRFHFIELYNHLVLRTSRNKDSQQDIINFLIGALIFEKSDIKFIEYKGRTCKKKIGWFWSSGSELYTIINTQLKITKDNPFGYDEQLFFLNQFCKKIEKVYPEDGLSLRNQANKLMEHLLKRNSEQLYALVHGVPIINVLLKNLQKLEEEYVKSKSYVNNPARLATLHCVQFIGMTYDEMDVKSISWHTCVGAVIYTLIQIDKEYKYFFSPTRSALFRHALKALNVESLSQISIDDQLKCLRAVSDHLRMVKEDHHYYESTIQKLMISSRAKLTKYQLNNEIKLFQTNIDKYINDLSKKSQTPSVTSNVVSTGVNYTIQYAMAPIAMQAAKSAIVGGLSLGGFLVEGPIGSAIFGGAGMLMMSGLSRLLKDGAITAVSGNICAWLLSKIGYTIGNATVNMVSYPFSEEPIGFDKMRSLLKAEDDVVFVNMVNTLLEIDHVIDQDKKHIREIFGLSEDAFLTTLSTNEKNVINFKLS